jgi:uncharacterized protein YbaR (Trm112 family)
LAGIFFCPALFRIVTVAGATEKEKISAGLDPFRDLAMMNLAYRIFDGASPMTLPEMMSPPQHQLSQPSRRRQHIADDYLVLSELNPRMVIDHIDDEEEPLHVLTFGSVREICPKCRTHQLKLVLRQQTVRVAHLFCAECESCFDAHYPNGTPALTI